MHKTTCIRMRIYTQGRTQNALYLSFSLSLSRPPPTLTHANRQRACQGSSPPPHPLPPSRCAAIDLSLSLSINLSLSHTLSLPTPPSLKHPHFRTNNKHTNTHTCRNEPGNARGSFENTSSPFAKPSPMSRRSCNDTICPLSGTTNDAGARTTDGSWKAPVTRVTARHASRR